MKQHKLQETIVLFCSSKENRDFAYPHYGVSFRIYADDNVTSQARC